MHAFLLQMMYASSDDELDAAKATLFNVTHDDADEDFELELTQKYRRRVKKFMDRGDEWLLIRRHSPVEQYKQRPGVTHGCKRVAAGRPSSTMKRPHNEETSSSYCKHRRECFACQVSRCWTLTLL